DVDLSVVKLDAPEPAPFGKIRPTLVTANQNFFTSKWSTSNQNIFSDGTIKEVGKRNAYCEDWPEKSTFVSRELVTQPGDSGGPLWIGDEIVGVVHGAVCRLASEPEEHVFTHVPQFI